MALGSFIKEVENACIATLNTLGFVKRKGISILPVNSDVYGWIGLNTATRQIPDTMLVNPVIGVRYNPIHKIIAEVEKIKDEKYFPPTIAANIGYLMPKNQYYELVFEKGSDIAPVLQSLHDLVASYGLEFIKTNSRLDKILEKLPSKGSCMECITECSLVGYYLAGKDKQFLNDYIAESIEKGKNKKPVFYWEGFEIFAAKFMKYIETK